MRLIWCLLLLLLTLPLSGETLVDSLKRQAMAQFPSATHGDNPKMQIFYGHSTYQVVRHGDRFLALTNHGVRGPSSYACWESRGNRWSLLFHFEESGNEDKFAQEARELRALFAKNGLSAATQERLLKAPVNYFPGIGTPSSISQDR